MCGVQVSNRLPKNCRLPHCRLHSGLSDPRTTLNSLSGSCAVRMYTYCFWILGIWPSTKHQIGPRSRAKSPRVYRPTSAGNGAEPKLEQLAFGTNLQNAIDVESAAMARALGPQKNHGPEEVCENTCRAGGDPAGRSSDQQDFIGFWRPLEDPWPPRTLLGQPKRLQMFQADH